MFKESSVKWNPPYLLALDRCIILCLQYIKWYEYLLSEAVQNWGSLVYKSKLDQLIPFWSGCLVTLSSTHCWSDLDIWYWLITQAHDALNCQGGDCPVYWVWVAIASAWHNENPKMNHVLSLEALHVRTSWAFPLSLSERVEWSITRDVAMERGMFVHVSIWSHKRAAT